MNEPLSGFHKEVKDQAIELLWSQWARVGVGADITPYHGAVLDPEVMVCASVFLGRFEPRLIGEPIGWTVLNKDRISVSRTRRMCKRHFSGDTNAGLEVTLEHLNKATGQKRFEVESRNEKESMQTSDADKGLAVYLGHLRNSIVHQDMSLAPDVEATENLRFKIRDLFGVNTRSEIICYMLFHPRSNSNAVARAIELNQAQVYKTMGQMVEAGVMGRPRSGNYKLDTDRFDSFLGSRRSAGYIQWQYFYSALEVILLDRLWHPGEYSSDYLRSARYLDLAPNVAIKLQESELRSINADIVQPASGDRFCERFEDAILQAIDDSRS